MSQPEQRSRIAVLLFTDMVESVALQDRLGTEAYSRLLQQHHELLYRALETAVEGQVRNDTGDGVLCEFHTPAGAVRAALLFQMFLREAKWEREAPRVRVGIHQGQLAEFQLNNDTSGRLVGMPVNIAARIMGLAQAGQILMTRPVYEDARQFVREHPTTTTGARPPALEWRPHGKYFFKGTDDATEIFEVGAAGFAPLTAPPSTDKARSATEPPRSEVQLVARKRSPVVGAVLTVVCGLLLWATAIGERWENASYDSLFRFGSPTVTNQVVLVLMDNEAHAQLNQPRSQPWDRGLHAKLLNKLADDGCPLVALDVQLLNSRDPETDRALVSAMERLTNIVLAAGLAKTEHYGADAVRPIPPAEMFVQAVRTNWGVTRYDADLDLIVRRDWPFPSPDDAFKTLPWVMAELAGVKLSSEKRKRYLSYYDFKSTWTSLSYSFALTTAPGFFRDKVVFIGNKPKTTLPGNEDDEFCPPHFSWTGETVGGVELLATSFLNLMNNSSWYRTAWPLEGIMFLISGVVIGGGLCRFRPLPACGLALGIALGVMLLSVWLTHANYWFPWLIVVGGQLPCALVWALIPARVHAVPAMEKKPAVAGKPAALPATAKSDEAPLPEAPDYEFVAPAFGKGGFGKVWIVRNAVGQWQALKAVYQSNFGDNRGPYETEFKGLERYKPVSEKHPGLLRIDLVSRMKDEGYFYYVMELGDAMTPGWETQPHLYRPRDLESLRKQAYGRRLPVAECLRIVTTLAEALSFLHQQGLTHRDIKPSNVIFVNGRPKLADVGLVTDIRPAGEVRTLVGTPGYMPPPPEKSGTPQADIYALGMLLYVISTGREPDLFPDISTHLMDSSGHAEFIKLNAIVLKACQPDAALRYQTAAEMLRELEAARGSGPAS